jgi:hypothetical protein
MADAGIGKMVVQLFDPALFRSGIAVETQHPRAYQPLDWSKVNLFELQNLLEEIKIKKNRDLSIRFASDMTPSEIVAFLAGEFNKDIWMCDEVFDSMRCSPKGYVYTCNGTKMGELGQNSVLDIWNLPAYKTFRHGHWHKNLDPECTGCCKVRRKPDGSV